ncbi:hypothetical protein ykris0001_27690 [Yersinia kristensenii ATCC 33638]|nr:hypothetical protein ykris0001_27690 [Yersinia kristensenii ATCC 33638]
MWLAFFIGFNTRLILHFYWFGMINNKKDLSQNCDSEIMQM